MATTNASKAKQQQHQEREQTHPVSQQAESRNDGLNFFSSTQWMDVLGAISIAAARAAEDRNYQQLVNYNGLSETLSRRLQASGTIGKSPPLVMARAAGA